MITYTHTQNQRAHIHIVKNIILFVYIKGRNRMVKMCFNFFFLCFSVFAFFTLQRERERWNVMKWTIRIFFKRILKSYVFSVSVSYVCLYLSIHLFFLWEKIEFIACKILSSIFSGSTTTATNRKYDEFTPLSLHLFYFFLPCDLLHISIFFFIISLWFNSSSCPHGDCFYVCESWMLKGYSLFFGNSKNMHLYKKFKVLNFKIYCMSAISNAFI